MYLFLVIIIKIIGKFVCEFVNEYLFKFIGMKVILDYDMKDFGFEDFFGKNFKGWVKDRQGYFIGGWGFILSVRDML